MARTKVLGKSGQGKSWKLGKYLEEVVPKFPYAVHYDIDNEEAGLCIEGTDGSPPVFKTLYVDRRAYAGEFDLKRTIVKNKKLRVVPDGLTKEEMEDLFGQLSEIAMEIADKADGGFHLSVDEAHNVIPEKNIDDRVSRALTGGRKRGLEWAVSTQRAKNIHEDALSQANWGIYFCMTADSDLIKVGRSVDAFDAYTELPKLSERECIIEDANAGDWWVVNTDDEERMHPHTADDDGKADEYLAGHQDRARNPEGSTPEDGEVDEE